MQRFCLLIIMCIFLTFTACSKSNTQKIGAVAKENSPAPDISVISITNGSTLKLSDLKGKVVLLNFWAAGISCTSQSQSARGISRAT